MRYSYRTIRICPDVMFGFMRGFVEVIHSNSRTIQEKRYYRNPTEASLNRAHRIAVNGNKHRVGLYDQTWFIEIADVPRVNELGT